MNPTPDTTARTETAETVIVTEAMRKAGYDSLFNEDGSPTELFANEGFVPSHAETVFRAMIAASPPVPSERGKVKPGLLAQHQSIYDEWLTNALDAARAVSIAGVRIPSPTEGSECAVPFDLLRKLDAALAAVPAQEAGRDDRLRVADTGLQAAIQFVENRRDDYVREFGSYDYSTGVTEFPGNGDETVGEWEEIIEGLRALADNPRPVENGEAVAWAAWNGESFEEVGFDEEAMRYRHEPKRTVVPLFTTPDPHRAEKAERERDAGDLLPCPFCDNAARLVEGHRDHWIVECVHCCARTGSFEAREGAKNRAAAHWNRRAAREKAEQEAAGLREALDAAEKGFLYHGHDRLARDARAALQAQASGGGE